ncbi:MAG: hypothetical protein K8J31_18170 [Anaerolineae bacterium]|nr:hypothetical protein [Anaerolineae bacterium]
MIVHYTKIKGQIKNGRLEIELPDNVTDGEVTLKLPILVDEQTLPSDERPWTDEEIAEMLRPDPKTGAEIVAEMHKTTRTLEDDPYHLDSPVIVRMMRTSIWDVCRMIQRELED